MTKIIFFGPPGAGKGTQAKIISNKLDLQHLSTGDILRSKILEKDDLALELKAIMASGKLVSDDILNKIVFSKISNEYSKGFILDGYPRTLEQSYFLNDIIQKLSSKIDFIFNIEIKLNILKERIIKRSIEEKRDDDTLEIFETRFLEYTNTTAKVSDYYKQLSPEIFYEINGTLQIDEITKKIIEILKKPWKLAINLNIYSWLKT